LFSDADWRRCMSTVLDCRVYLRAQIWWARQTQNVSDAEVCCSLFCAHSRVYMTHIGSIGGIATLVGTKACLNRVITQESHSSNNCWLFAGLATPRCLPRIRSGGRAEGPSRQPSK
jgi:hypothetical protein